MQFAYELRSSWAPLAWVAELSPGDGTLRVLHGPRVETAADWFCEAVWDGSFAQGDFDRTDLVFGSGARRRGDRAYFISSGSTVDRLHVLASGGITRISNSLPCLLAVVDAGADPIYPHYIRDLQSIIKGQRDYTRTIPTTAGPVRLVYFRNLVWDGRSLEEVDKPGADRRFEAFDDYHRFLATGVARVLANAGDPLREQRFTPFGSLSSGYDSPTVATLARDHGLTHVMSLVEARGGLAEDARPIAKALGLEIVEVKRDAWRERPLSEIPFLAADGRGEDVFFAGAEPHLANRVLLTGFHGDKIWDKYTKPAYLNPRIMRGDQSGTTLTEYRLWTGFIHFPVPFMGVRAIADVNAISKSPEMAPWDVGGDHTGPYTRPICRRIVENAGVPREAFGMMKKAASVLFNGEDRVYQPSTRADHGQWSRSAREAWLAGGLVAPHVVDRVLEASALAWRGAIDTSVAVARGGQKLWKRPFQVLEWKVDKHRHVYPEFLRNNLMYRSIFAWAIDRAKERYRAGAAASANRVAADPGLAAVSATFSPAQDRAR